MRLVRLTVGGGYLERRREAGRGLMTDERLRWERSEGLGGGHLRAGRPGLEPRIIPADAPHESSSATQSLLLALGDDEEEPSGPEDRDDPGHAPH